MAVSGFILVGFVIGHFLGNLQLYLGPEAINGYAAKLHSMPPLMWTARIVLLLAVGVHIGSAFSLWSNANKSSARLSIQEASETSRPTTRRGRCTGQGRSCSPSSCTTCLHFTIAPAHPGDVYRNVVEGFQDPLIAGVYIVGNLALGFHIFHGIYSAFQTLGANHPSLQQLPPRHRHCDLRGRSP